MQLFGYWRSGTTYRVRLAMGAKRLDYDTADVDLRRGAHRQVAFMQRNPSGTVPTLVLPDGTHISQSTAIIEYLEDRFPEPPLLPAGAKARARVRQLCNIVACDIHPLQNLRVQKYLKENLDQPPTEVSAWLTHFMAQGFAALEKHLEEDTARGGFCFGGKFSMVECYLLPQLYAARRFNVPLDAYPLLTAVETTALALEFVQAAAPEAQPGAHG